LVDNTFNEGPEKRSDLSKKQKPEEKVEKERALFLKHQSHRLVMQRYVRGYLRP
jgi:hypothetical protein